MSKQKIKKSIKEHTSLIVLSSIIILVVIGSYYDGTFNPDNKYIKAKAWAENLQLKCEIKTGVPDNYYTGQIHVGREQQSSLLLTLMLPFGTITEEQKDELRQIVDERAYAMPCGEEYKLLKGINNNE